MGELNFFKSKPKVANIDVDAYLKRIGENRDKPTLGYLRKLHRAHLLSIPFENLDIHYQKKIVLDFTKIFEKIILRRRGGYCYELNGLFYQFLYHLGFECKIISARVWNENSAEFGKEYDHMAIVVLLEGEEFLVDVGFGKGMIYPKKIEENVVQMDYTNYWRFQKDPDENYLLQISEDASVFTSRYAFSKESKEIIQFMEMNEFHQRAQSSTFTDNKMITRLTETGRITLTDRKFKELKLGETHETEITNEDEFLSKLEQHFGITFQELILREQK